MTMTTSEIYNEDGKFLWTEAGGDDSDDYFDAWY